MLKAAFFPAADQHGQHVFPLYNTRTGALFEKVAAPNLLPEVLDFIEHLTPQNDSQYALLNAMAAGEYFGSNINGDWFPEEALIHKPDNWTGDPEFDRELAKNWPYGFPTFYNAGVFAHHRNKDMSRSFGRIEVAAWHPGMKRVELVVRLDKLPCLKFGGTGLWDKLKAGQLFDVSMGCKVPFDTCSICLDWPLYREAQATFDPGIHKHPGQAVLEFHKKLIQKRGHGIRGLAITRKDYCDHARRMMNRIFPDGRKAFVYNDYPRFFDISGVFIGADKTAKAMVKIAEAYNRSYHFFWARPSAEVAEDLGYDEAAVDKIAMAVLTPQQFTDRLVKSAFLGKGAKVKRSEISKDVVPSQLAGAAVPLMTGREKRLPGQLLDRLAKHPLEDVLSTSGGMGVVLRPGEFQRMMLGRLGLGREAKELERRNIVFPKVEEESEVELSKERFSHLIAKLLQPFFDSRSSFGPAVEKRVTVIMMGGPSEKSRPASQLSPLLHKIGSAYAGYRRQLMQFVPEAVELGRRTPDVEELHKCASVPVDQFFTPLSVAYLKNAFWDEVGVNTGTGPVAGVERVYPRGTRVL